MRESLAQVAAGPAPFFAAGPRSTFIFIRDNLGLYKRLSMGRSSKYKGFVLVNRFRRRHALKLMLSILRSSR
jgi:hypothetical protein